MWRNWYGWPLMDGKIPATSCCWRFWRRSQSGSEANARQLERCWRSLQLQHVENAATQWHWVSFRQSRVYFVFVLSCFQNWPVYTLIHIAYYRFSSRCVGKLANVFDAIDEGWTISARSRPITNIVNNTDFRDKLQLVWSALHLVASVLQRNRGSHRKTESLPWPSHSRVRSSWWGRQQEKTNRPPRDQQYQRFLCRNCQPWSLNPYPAPRRWGQVRISGRSPSSFQLRSLPRHGNDRSFDHPRLGGLNIQMTRKYSKVALFPVVSTVQVGHSELCCDVESSDK